MTIISSQRTIGSIVYVDSANASILLNNDLKSSLYADTGSLTLISQVGGYLLFPCGVGEYIVGILASAYEKEEPNFKRKDDDSFTLHLSESKRTLRTNLLGTLVSNNKKFCFKKGISVYPALGSEALIPSGEQIKAILNYPIEEGKDLSVLVGESPIYTGTEINLSLQNLFAFCLGIIGNTGSGKSFTVASLIQSAIKSLETEAKDQNKQAKPKFIILDINGEYSNAFKKKEPEKGREINHAYLNGKDFKLPLWAFENDEICKFFRASSQVQTPTLEKLIDNLRSKERPKDFSLSPDIWGLESLQGYLEGLYSKAKIKNGGRSVGLAAADYIKSIKSRIEKLKKYSNSEIKQICEEVDKLLRVKDLKNLEEQIKSNKNSSYEMLFDLVRWQLKDPSSLFKEIEKEIQVLKEKKKKADLMKSTKNNEERAIKPTYFNMEELKNHENWKRVFKSNQDEDDSFESSKVHENTIGLRLRIRKFLDEQRYQVFRDIEIKTYDELVRKIISPDEAITVIDCSMLNKEVLPFFCAVIGRILLSERENRPIEKSKEKLNELQREDQPWCLVLEEAHNYVRPYREGEGSELRLCRQVFERIAKEGRKFGLSLVVASQRPSEISDTILSQCANFIVHRLQNPDDIDHFKKILPSGSREILDQVSILKSGETLIMGTSSNVPLKVQITLPTPKPHSESPNLADKWIL